ncbi:MAG TPA: GAF domain-containing protein, partial [Steroidobacteraceae bacterium]|nr:GAF domain-containing protein [Steroidobacteraceae bacterium]
RYASNHPIRPGRGTLIGRTALEKTVHLPDCLADPEYAAIEYQSKGKYRTTLGVPLQREGMPVGVIALMRSVVRPFTETQIELVTTFAEQAVIAIEKVRLLNEVQTRTEHLAEALEQQTATSEVLKVISSSPGELEPVFNAMLENAVSICDAKFGNLFLIDSDGARWEAGVRTPPKLAKYFTRSKSFLPTPGAHIDRVMRTKQVSHTADDAAEAVPGAASRLGGARSTVCVPMVKDSVLVGAIFIYRTEVRPFTDRQIELVQNFAAQAVIAIENARLLSELRESLQQQTATADVLKVLSRSAFNLQTVLDTLVESATRLCEAQDAIIFLPSGEVYRAQALHGYSTEYHQFIESNPIAIDRGSVVGRTAIDKQVVHVSDVLADPNYTQHDAQRMAGYRTALAVPLLREGNVAGVIFLTRTKPQPFTQKQIELITTFADQAVIAIENVRLFDEVQARTEDLKESLEQQTSTTEVLKIIGRSAFDLQPVFDTIAENAVRLCEAERAYIFRFDGEVLRAAASYNVGAEMKGWVYRNPIVPGRHSVSARSALERRTVQVHDVQADPEYTYASRDVDPIRTILSVPMLKGDDLVGIITIYRLEVKPFTDKQISLVETFADQAVIAIENVRLFDEVQARTEDLRESLQQQTATAEVLKVISRSAFDLETVLRTLVESAARLCEADKGTITRQKDGAFYRAESFGFSRKFMDHVRDIPVAPDRGSATGRALLEGVAVHIPDVQADADYHFDEALRLGNYRTLLAIPMMREGTPIGVVTLTRSEARPFTEKQIELVTTFADQAAIAIENVRLFEQVQERTKELSESLDELRTAQDRLIQTEKLASLGQLTAGIAHEIKNPLNFVNNFSALSVELVDELDDVLKPAALDKRTREETKELTVMLKGNLEKVVQHGRRADSIVKNMLLHSREGSGERRSVDINAVVEDSLNLAYHGARAEKQAFDIRLERSFDPAAGMVDLFPQEITRVLLNMISNGVYAAMKRKAEMRDGYEPTLFAATGNLGDRVEIRIRDNGGGISPAIKEKIFNPFFTTKPPGEGTGLGLSLSYDIVVKQHAGSIEVDTQPGEFTEFRVILPRRAAPSKTGANS